MESSSGRPVAAEDGLAPLFSDLVRLETELWALIDRRLRRDQNLQLSWFEPMQVMDRTPDCRVADIAAALSITVGGTSKLIDRIERAGLCHRTPNPTDARSALLALTPTGRRLFHSAQRSFEDELARRLGTALPPERLAALAAALTDVRQHIATHQGSNP